MKLIIYSSNFFPELTGIGKYNSELASEIIERGSQVCVITAPPYYPEWMRHKGYSNTWEKSIDRGIEVYRCPLFVPKKVTTLNRILHLVSFAFSSALRLITLVRLSPSVIFVVQPTLFCAPAALFYGWLVRAKTVMHIQDYEVDAMFGLKTSGESGVSAVKRNRLQKLVSAVEAWFLRRFDMVTTISNSMLERAAQKGVSQVRLRLFPNWSDTEFVTPEVDGSEIRRAWGYSEQDMVVLYSGNIGQKQGLEIVLEAAKAMESRPNVKFLLIGTGAFAGELQQAAKDKGLANIEFKPLQPWEDVPKILAMADVHLVVQKVGAADAVLPSKLTNILSAGGHALVTAEKNTELGKIAEDHPGIYELVEPENTAAFIQGLERCLEKDTTQPNRVARNYACEYLNKDRIIDRFVADLQELVGSKENKGFKNEC
ncbi:WcaI family glycosyltransferase [Microbulbifer sp. MCCC 1A16149]|uniref:WcaI family glycosyltransferase n=1 Tax=Microbulbifer sp. MCCC 1A16149 TaxID=3411322 RepID=UPI003D0D03DC